LIGTGIGAGAGMGLGIAAYSQGDFIGAVIPLFAVIGAGVGAAIGAVFGGRGKRVLMLRADYWARPGALFRLGYWRHGARRPRCRLDDLAIRSPIFGVRYSTMCFDEFYGPLDYLARPFVIVFDVKAVMACGVVHHFNRHVF
jgi:hypothetical protein